MTETVDPLRNPKDPLHKTGPELEKELFKKFADLANGFPNDTVLRSALNLIINAVRQAEPTRARAERVYDDLMLRSKSVLLEQHYDNTGKRRNIFPFDQHLVAEDVLIRNKQRW